MSKKSEPSSTKLMDDWGACNEPFYDSDAGPNPLIRHLAKKDLQKVLICPDVHVPYHDRAAWKCFLQVAQEWKPDVLVVLGDFGDFYPVSQYRKDPKRRKTLTYEIRRCNAELDQLDLAVGRWCAKKFCRGNHEARLENYVADHAEQLTGIVPDVAELFRLKARGFEVIPYGDYVSVGKLSFSHDVDYSGVNAPRQSVEAFGGCIIFGHTHRAGSHYSSTIKGERHFGLTCGWLGDWSFIDYKHRAKVRRENQLGFGVAHIDAKGLGWAQFVPILNGRAVVDGKVYRA